MKTKTLLFFVTALLSVMGAKADVIPSSYYSEPAEGTFYIYNVTQDKFLNASLDLVDNPTEIVFEDKGSGAYSITPNGSGNCIKMGSNGTQFIWRNDAYSGHCGQKWSFTEDGSTKTYWFSTTADQNYDNNYFISGNTYYLNNKNSVTTNQAEADKWAVITEADYYKFLVDRDTSIPSSFFTTTPTAGTYYLYNIEKNGFICDGNNYVGLQSAPVALSVTSDGNGAFYIQLPDNDYLHTGFAEINKVGYHVWADGKTTTTSGDYAANWTLESFHGVSGVFFVKSPVVTVHNIEGNWHLYATGIANNGVNAWPTPDANKTNYAWALISETDYTAWQNGFYTLDEATGYSAERDIEGVNVTVNKSMTAGVWNTFVVPFNMAIPSGWTVKEPKAFDGSTLTFGDASSIVAGKPYIVKPTEAVTSFYATSVTLKKDLNNTTVGTGTTVTMTGTYSKIDAVENDSYIIGIKDGENALYKVNSTVSLKPFRAYFTVAGVAGVKANVIGLNFDYETGITEHFESIHNSECIMLNEAGAMFDLSGRRVSKAQKGLYILNGRKVLVK